MQRRNLNLSVLQGKLVNFTALSYWIFLFFPPKLMKPFMSELAQAFLNTASDVSLLVALLGCFFSPTTSGFWHIRHVRAYTADSSFSSPDKAGKGQLTTYLVGQEEISQTFPFSVIFFESSGGLFIFLLTEILQQRSSWNWVLVSFFFIKSSPLWTRKYFS